MKKTYISPLTKITVVHIQQHLLTGSDVFDKSASSGKAVLGRSDNSWDIWGNEMNDEDFED